jgi:hypothetical protein
MFPCEKKQKNFLLKIAIEDLLAFVGFERTLKHIISDVRLSKIDQNR